MATKKYILTLNDIRKKYEHPPSWIRITTITMLCKFLKDIKLDKVRQAFANGPIRIRRKGALTNGFEWTLRESDKAFYNQVTIGYQDTYSTKSIKVFPNGSFQVAGCSDLRDCKRIASQLAFLMKIIFEISIEMENFRIVMINTNFSVNAHVDLSKVIETLSSEKKFIVSFNPDRYSAVKVKFHPAENTKQVTASIFSTGKIIVTGAETLREIALAYEVLNEKLYPTKLVSSAVEDTFDIFKGVKFDKLVQSIEKSGVTRFS
jgi:TATA-box binding protein (TBP) (component of TFIID and TFIIIB)